VTTAGAGTRLAPGEVASTWARVKAAAR
jgi:hypothetical protein